MYHDVASAKHIEKYTLEITFADGQKGSVDLQSYAKKGGVFSQFSDLEYFKQFYINRELGVLCWPGGVDIAPETLYHQITHAPYPDWMTPKVPS